MPSTQETFENLLRLVGKKVEVGVASAEEIINGVVTNCMFDSFLLEVNGATRIVAFDDILFLRELSS